MGEKVQRRGGKRCLIAVVAILGVTVGVLAAGCIYLKMALDGTFIWAATAVGNDYHGIVRVTEENIGRLCWGPKMIQKGMKAYAECE